jgi:hypothetical protein
MPSKTIFLEVSPDLVKKEKGQREKFTKYYQAKKYKAPKQ